MEQSTEFIHKATIRENVGHYTPSFGLFDSDEEACHWLSGEGWEQILVNGPNRTFRKTIGGKVRTVEVVKLDFEPIHVISKSYWEKAG